MLPRVIIHNAVSLDGRIDWFSADVGTYYELAGRWDPDAMLSGSNTILAAFPNPEGEEEPGSLETDAGQERLRQLLVVPDSRGRIRSWGRIRREPYWRDVVVLCSHATPRTYLAYLERAEIEHILAGDDRVDLRGALEMLRERYGVQTVRVDSGGILNGVLLRAGLVDEVSVLVHPALVGGSTARSFFRAPDLASAEGVIALRLIDLESLKGDVVWLRYEIVKCDCQVQDCL